MTTKPCNIPCPKCGSGDINREFNEKGKLLSFSRYGDCGNKYASGGLAHTATVTRDHIAHHCRCCRYEWQTLPLPKGGKKL